MPKVDLSAFILASDRVVMFSTYFKLESTSRYYLTQGLEQLSTMWSSVTDSYNKLTKAYAKIEKEDEGVPEDREAMNKKYFECFEIFCTFSGKLQERLEAVSTEVQGTIPVEHTSGTTNVLLPPCDIEPFKGDFISWPAFRDLFSAVYVKNTRLAPIEKLYHLLHKTKGEAHEIVKRAPLTNVGFALAWANLSKAYENKRVLTNLQLDLFFRLKSVTSEHSVDLKTLINGINSVLDCLQLLGISVMDWDPIVVYHCCRRLPDATLSLWEQSLDNKTELPTWNSLNAFLDTRCLALDSIASTRKPMQSNIQQKAQSKPVKSHTTKVAISKKGNDLKCVACSATNHRLWLCDTFKLMQPAQRLNFAKTQHLCLNCLSLGHRLDSCSSKYRCTACNRKHHTLLHLIYVNFVLLLILSK